MFPTTLELLDWKDRVTHEIETVTPKIQAQAREVARSLVLEALNGEGVTQDVAPSSPVASLTLRKQSPEVDYR